MTTRTMMRRGLAAAALAGVVWLCPASGAAQGIDLGPVVDALGVLQETVRVGLAGVSARLDALLYPRWEYRIFTANKLDTLDGRTQTTPDYAGLGRDGWELVGFTQDQTYIFKRRAR